MAIFAFWVFLLLTTQLWINLVEGNTTNESINYKRYATGNSYPTHGHSHKNSKSKPETSEELLARAQKLKQFMPLKMSVSSRFMDLFHLRRRNIDWSTCYTEDDLVKGGLMRRVEVHEV